MRSEGPAAPSFESKMFGALVVLVGIIVVATVGYDLYRYPSVPEELGKAEVEVVGTGHFQGDVGSYQGETCTVEGMAPFSATFPYKEADYVFADIERDSQQSVKLLIKGRVVEADRGSTFLIWDSPRRKP